MTFYYVKKTRGDSTPWSRIPPLVIHQDLPPIKIGLYKGIHCQPDGSPEDAEEMDQISQDMVEQMTKENNKRHISHEESGPPPPASPNIHVMSSSQENTNESSNDDENDDVSKDDENEDEIQPTGTASILNSTPLDHPVHHKNQSTIQKKNIALAPETPAPRFYKD